MALAYPSSFLASVSDRAEPLLAAAMPEWKLISTDFQDAPAGETGRQLGFNFPRIMPFGTGEGEGREVETEHDTIVRLNYDMDKSFWIRDTDMSYVNSTMWIEKQFVPALTGAIMTSCWRVVLEQFRQSNTGLSTEFNVTETIPHTGVLDTNTEDWLPADSIMQHITHTSANTPDDALRFGRGQNRTVLLHPVLLGGYLHHDLSLGRNSSVRWIAEDYPSYGRKSIAGDGTMVIQHDWFPVNDRDSVLNEIESNNVNEPWRCLAGLIISDHSVIAVARTPAAPEAEYLSTSVIRVGDGGLPVRLTMSYDLDKRRYRLRANTLFGARTTYDSSAGKDIPFHRITAFWDPSP